MKLYSADTSVRKEESAKRLDFYHDNQLPYLEKQLDELFSDPSKMLKIELNVVKKVINAYGVWGPKKFMGREYDGIHRTTFVINEKGIIETIFTKVKTKEHSEQILGRI